MRGVGNVGELPSSIEARITAGVGDCSMGVLGILGCTSASDLTLLTARSVELLEEEGLSASTTESDMMAVVNRGRAPDRTQTRQAAGSGKYVIIDWFARNTKCSVDVWNDVIMLRNARMLPIP